MARSPSPLTIDLHVSALPGLYCPALHVRQALAPAALTWPPGHCRQLLWPTPPAYWPAAHTLHVAWPVTALYFPDAHGVHDPDNGPLAVPTAQAAQGVDPPGDHCPATQPVHDDWAVAVVYRPAGHVVQPADALVLVYVPEPQAEHAPTPPTL